MDVTEPPTVTIACDDCVMRRSSACADCLVTFFVGHEEPADPLVLDAEQDEVVRLLARAGLIPALQHQLAG